MNDRTPHPDNTWGPDTQRILARIDDQHANTAHDPEAYAAQLAEALATPTE